jgi:hypothetical protein
MFPWKAPASPPGLSFTLCVSAGTELGGKCGVGQLVMSAAAHTQKKGPGLLKHGVGGGSLRPFVSLRPHPPSVKSVSETLASPLVLPEIAEPLGREFAISNRMLDVLVAEIVLQRPSIHTLIGQLEPSRMPQHVGWIGNGILAVGPSRVTIRRKATADIGAPRSLMKTYRPGFCSRRPSRGRDITAVVAGDATARLRLALAVSSATYPD